MPKMTHEIGLTYPKTFPVDGEIVKTHLHKIKLRLGYRDIKIFWFMEFQQRGAAHFHMLSNKEIDADELKKMWFEIVGSDDLLHLKHGAHIEPIRTPEGALHYLTGYLTKQEQKIVPVSYRNLGRYWGYSLSLLPHSIKVIFGTPKELRMFKSIFRPIRKWIKSRKRQWKSKKKYKPIRNIYTVYLPGEYLTVRNGRLYTEELRRRGLDVSLFECDS